MASSGIQMFMQKLNQLIHCNDIPLFINNPEIIIAERPQFQLLYDDLASMIQILSLIDQHQNHHLEKVNDLKQRFRDAVEEAEYIVDLFLSGVHISRNNRLLPTFGDFKQSLNLRGSFKSVCYMFLSWVLIRINVHFLKDFKSLNLDDVRRSFKSLEVEFMTIKMETTMIQSAPLSISTNSHKKLFDDILVGLDHDVELIRDKLVADRPTKVDVVSIVGMGGIGKSTLATKVFNDPFIMHHFHIRVWVTVSQSYDNRGVLTQILESIGVKEGLEEATDSRLRELVHKKLMGRKYLIMIDDIWDVETWDNMKLFFPHGNNGSRILLTTRLTEVAKHANSDGLIHQLGYLNKEKGWELLCHKVFHGNQCPEWSIKLGMQIIENCKGLPLVVVVIAGILAKNAWSRNLWTEIAERTGSYIVGEKSGCLETLGLSYSHLPPHLRECFLYLGGFPEDYEFEVQKLIWLWVAEGFIEEDGNRSLEDIAKGYLTDLVDRSLVIIARRSKYNGDVKACKVHDLVRELCLRKAMEERFILQIHRSILSTRLYDVITTPYKPIRKFIYFGGPNLSYLTTQNLRSIIWSEYSRFLSVDIINYFRSFVLLRVLDIHNFDLRDFPKGIELMVHLRYLAIRKISVGFPSSVCNLWGLQTLIYDTRHYLGDSVTVKLPSNISGLVNLRHLWGRNSFSLPFIEKPLNLQTIYEVELEDGVVVLQKCFPYVRELTCTAYLNKEYDFKSLAFLEKLYLRAKLVVKPICGKNHITFPETLKSLTLSLCHIPWSDMSIIQSLPNLEVLKLHADAFEGSVWKTDEQEFRKLKFLRLRSLDIKVWEAYSTSFPCLKQLDVIWCRNLEEIPLEIGDIPTLELIKIWRCRSSVGESVRRIQEEQQDMGNYDLKIDVSDILS